jgi:hypothetical protein
VLLERAHARVHRALGLEQILAGLDEQRVGAAGDETHRLLAVAVVHPVPVDLPEADELGAGAERPDDEARLVGRLEGVAGGPGDLRRLAVEVAGPAHEVVVELGEDQLVGPEGVGLHGVGAGLQEGPVDALHQLRAAPDEQVHAVLVAEIVPVDRQVEALEGRPHRPVEDENPLLECLEEAAGHEGIISWVVQVSSRISG